MAESIGPKNQVPIPTKGLIPWCEFLSPWCGKGFLSPWCGKGFSPAGVARDFSPPGVAKDSLPLVWQGIYLPSVWQGISLPSMWQEIFLHLVIFLSPKSAFSADSLRVFTQPLCAIVCVNVCACVKNPKHWQPYIHRIVWTHENTVHTGRNG